MKSKIGFKILRLALLMTLSATQAMPQTLSKPSEGVVVNSDNPSSPVESVEVQTAYRQYIDEASGMTADDLVRYALEHNGELAAARQMIAEVKGRLKQAGLKPNPMVEASGSQAVTSPDNNLMIGAELPLELGGRRKARVAVVQCELEMREAEVADFERKLAADVRMKYAEAIAAALNLKLTEDSLNLIRTSYRLVQARVEKGRSAPLEQQVLSVEVSRLDTLRIGSLSKTDMGMFELRKVIGMSPAEGLKLRSEFQPQRRPVAQNEALHLALEKRPDLVAARASENLASAQIEQARTEGKVDASLFANYERMNFGYDVSGFNSRGALVPVTGIFHYATFGVRLTLPVRNKNQGAIEAAIAAAEAAHKRREFAEIVVRNEIAAAYLRYERAQAALEVYSAGVSDQSLRNLEVIRRAYELGQKTLLDYVQEQRRLVEVETGFTDLLKEYLYSLIEIDRVAGSTIPSA